MSASVIGEAILIIASVIVAGVVAGIVMSKVGIFESTITSTSKAQQDKMLTKIKVLYATNSTSDTVNVWVKNVGINPITFPNSSDIYFGQINSVQRLPFNEVVSDLTWRFHPLTPLVWNVLETVQLNVTDNNLSKGPSYLVRVITPYGISDDHIFSLP